MELPIVSSTFLHLYTVKVRSKQLLSHEKYNNPSKIVIVFKDC